MRVYVAGPITGNQNYRERFAEMTEKLRKQGHVAVNPVELDDAEDGELTWAEYMRRDLKALLDCDAICLLPGWTVSPGATLEHHVASRLGMVVVGQ